jgi:hypothetical protein
VSDTPDRRSDFSSRPPDPAGTKPKVDESSLLPADGVSLLPSDADVIDSTAEEESLESAPVDVADELAGSGDLLPERRAAAGVGPVAAAVETPHAPRFQFILGALIALAVAAIAVTGAVLINHKDPRPPAFWSSWHPTAVGGNPAQQIADHVGHQYRLPSGHELVTVNGGPLQQSGVPINVVVRSDPQNGGDITIISGNGLLFQLCGVGTRCSIDEGKPSRVRHLLLQREALELALYSFRYIAGVGSVTVILPPPPGKSPGEAMLFRPHDLSASLHRPLAATLTPTPETPNSFKSSPDAPLVVSLTMPTLYNMSVTPDVQNSTLQLVLSPPGLATTGTTSSPGATTSSGGTTTTP